MSTKEGTFYYLCPSFSPQLYLFPHHKTTTKDDSHRQKQSRDQDVVETREREASSHQNHENERRYSRLRVRRKKEGTIVLILIPVLFLLRVSCSGRQPFSSSVSFSVFCVLFFAVHMKWMGGSNLLQTSLSDIWLKSSEGIRVNLLPVSSSQTRIRKRKENCVLSFGQLQSREGPVLKK